MKYYVDSIEQVKAEGDSYSEYGKRTKKNTYESALSDFYQGLYNVSTSKNHLYACLAIVDSTGKTYKVERIGTCQTGE